MSSSIISSLTLAGQQVSIYLGTLTLIAGVLGGFLVTLVFLSLRTFRQNTCAFYLIIMSVVNIGQMVTGLLSRIMISGFGIDWSQMSLFYCKFRQYCFQVCGLISMTCFCLATIDQYLATCSRPQWQQWSNIKLARRLSAIFVLIAILHNVPCLIYYNLVTSTSTGQVTCIITNNIFQQYFTFGTVIIVGKVLPLCIMFFFGFLAYRNVRQLSHRALPLVRRELDKQLTVMVLVQGIFAFFMVLPYSIVAVLNTLTQLNENPVIKAQLQFATTMTLFLVYIYFASPFYIFVCVSDRFRHQLIYVLFEIYVNRWRGRRMAVNQVMPQIG